MTINAALITLFIPVLPWLASQGAAQTIPAGWGPDAAADIY